MATKKTKTTARKQVSNKIEVNPLDLLMICTGEPKTARTSTLKRTLEENKKRKSAQEAYHKLLEFEEKEADEESVETPINGLIKAIIEVGSACVKNGELSEDSFNILKESLGVKTNKKRKDFNTRLFKTCVEQFIHRGGDTSRKITLMDEITNPGEIIPDNGTVFTADIKGSTIDIIVFGKDYEKILVTEENYSNVVVD